MPALHKNAKKVFGRPAGFFFPGDAIPILGTARQDHRRMRRQLAPAFSDSSIKQQEVTSTKYVQLFLDRLEEHSQGGKPLDIVQWIKFTMLDMTGDLAFIHFFHSLGNNAYYPWVQSVFLIVRGIEFMRFPGNYPLHSPLVPLFIVSTVKASDDGRMAAVEKTLARMTQSVEGKSGVHDFASYMMQPARSGEPGMTEEEILANTPILIIAGSETTGTAMSGRWFYLSQNPTVQETLTKEIRSTFTSEHDINFHTTAPLEYLGACLNEILRGEWIPEGTRISVFPWATFCDPAHFADPDSFSPQRWLQPPHPLYEETFSKDNRDAFKPFSFGTRNCIGQNLAYAEMRLIVARVLFRFEYTLLPNQQDWHRKQRIYLGWEKGPLNIQHQKRA
ncbi:hypothetical protein S40293_09054 [Stachybotrys chartarum IBT 40293]|nr:hypothetical protein S40293_09054 [Stachybotrys chartarum IBT 40293]